jgi:hypothetical protein
MIGVAIESLYTDAAGPDSGAAAAPLYGATEHS